MRIRTMAVLTTAVLTRLHRAGRRLPAAGGIDVALVGQDEQRPIGEVGERLPKQRRVRHRERRVREVSEHPGGNLCQHDAPAK